MPEYVARTVTVIDISDPRNIQVPQVYQIQSCILKFEHTSIDIGSYCFSDRQVNKNGVASKPIKNSQGIGVTRVSLDSFVVERVALLQKLVGWLASRAKSVSQTTLHNYVKRLLVFFQFYCTQSDLNYFQPENRSHYEEAARRYSANLVANQKLSSGAKFMSCKVVFEFAEFIFDQVALEVFDFDLIQNRGQKKNGTKPLLPEKLESALAVRSAIFEGFFDLIINKKTLPFPLKVPSVCDELNNTIWVGYKPWSGKSAFPRSKDFEKRRPKEWFDRELGVSVTKQQWLERNGGIRSRASGTWIDIQKEINKKNLDNSSFKQYLVEFASLSFLDLLLSLTGMNQQAALDLPWFGGYVAQRARQGKKNILLVSTDDQVQIECAKEPNLHLLSIKNRKGYQPVEVTMSSRYLPTFKKYLQLREYYLKGASDARLFPFKHNVLVSRRYYIQNSFPEIPKLGAHRARASLADVLLTEDDDVEVTAQLLQNTPSTVIKNYAAGTQIAHIRGLGGFFNSLDQQIRLTRNATNSPTETAVGSCDQGGTQPTPLSDAPFELDCSQQESCFFCEHYSVHADEIDIRKLLSVLYYINKGATRASDINIFNDLFGAVIKRIKGLLEKIENISPKKNRLVVRVKEEVFNNEELDEYWLYKLNCLEVLTEDR